VTTSEDLAREQRERELLRREMWGHDQDMRDRLVGGLTANQRQVGGSHYQSPIQHWDYVLANDIPYMEAQIIRYITRWRKKGGLSDLHKAQHFLEKLIEVNRGVQTG